jgi:hypothetical protein
MRSSPARRTSPTQSSFTTVSRRPRRQRPAPCPRARTSLSFYASALAEHQGGHLIEMHRALLPVGVEFVVAQRLPPRGVSATTAGKADSVEGSA